MVNKKWEVESGEFDVFVGDDSQAELKNSFNLKYPTYIPW